MGLSYPQIKTKDGSYTLSSPLFDECYHSVHDGALNETLQKHIVPALKYCTKDQLTILDICFGLGFNTFATIWYLQKEKIKKNVVIYSPEFDQKLIDSLQDFEYPKEFDTIKDIIGEVLRHYYYKDENIEIKLMMGDARDKIKDLSGIDIIYQDAFSPKKNPLLWTKEYFHQLYAISGDEVIITTYSIATPIRLAMYENGFKVYEYKSQSTRSQTIASKRVLPLQEIDMDKKLQNNPSAKSLRDSDSL